uniref:Uncharacterized protein n=1 Tax=Anopheles maculatus TaxID=74869 RepID=A0A182SZU1_9DIPT
MFSCLLTLLWFMLYYLCFAYCTTEVISSAKHSNHVKQQKLVSNDENSNNLDLPHPIVTFPTDHAVTQLDGSSVISPRRHKTRRKGTTTGANNSHRSKPKKRKNVMQMTLQSAARKGLQAMIELYDRAEPNLLKRGAVLDANDPGALLAQFSASNQTEMDAKAAYATLIAAKTFKERYN